MRLALETIQFLGFNLDMYLIRLELNQYRFSIIVER
jgi:hypothetical protein